MQQFIIRRTALLFGTVLAASIAVYAAMYAAPGDPIAVLTGGRQVTPEARALLTERYHLNDALPVRYWHWLTGALRGDYGYSTASRQDVSTLIAQRTLATVELVGYASIIVVAAGVTVGASLRSVNCTVMVSVDVTGFGRPTRPWSVAVKVRVKLRVFS